MSKLHCFFCGGAACKFENGENWPESAFSGVYSNWITPSILAMARPSTSQIIKHDLVKTLGIHSIFNLQLRGEHASCGEGNEQSGFSYDPQLFMDNNIFFYNFGWPDMGICTLVIFLFP
jgi:protein tyrosine phosphatase domain-containing protein 1